MHLLGDQDLPHPPAIAVDVLGRLLVDVPDSWHIIIDDSSRFVFVDEDEQPRGYLDVAHARVVLLDGLSGDRGT